MNLYQTKIYLKRLGNAIIGKEFTEPRYFWGLSDYILELIIQFIDEERSGYPISFTEDAWEKKLQGIKKHIEVYRYLDNNPFTTGEEAIKKHGELLSKAKRRVEKGIKDVFFNLWD